MRHAPDQTGAPLVKICGLRAPEQVTWVRQSGADLAGLIFAPSRRRVSIAEAQAIAAANRCPRDGAPDMGGAGTPPLLVGVFVDAPPEEIAHVAAACGLDFVQLSGHETPDQCAALVQRGLRVIKTLHIGPHAAAPAVLADLTHHAQAGAAMILLDTATAQGGGSGQPFDWTIARDVVAAAPVPVLLAGGLTLRNVAAAVGMVHPHGVDISSGVETDGAKDRAKMMRFVQAARIGRAGIISEGET